MNTQQPPTRMVADVGGTNTRIALFNPESALFEGLSSYKNRNFGRLEDIIAQWLDDWAGPKPQVCCMAVAAPPSGDRVSMSNIDWSFSCRELTARFGFSRLRRLNDFEANAYALPYFDDSDLDLLFEGTAGARGRLAVVGPGTGLGGAFLDSCTETARSFACEPGHMGLSPATDVELEVFRLLLRRYSNIYAELLVSGPGLVRLYQALGETAGEAAEALGPDEISRRGMAGEDKLCRLALETFCALLGSACGNYLLGSGSYGGLYLAGGIVPQISTFIRSSSFHQRMIDKGAMRHTLTAIPVHAITSSQPGLVGAAHAPL